eukprot:TRINITY_DN1285_c0_g7_i1.p1 TRINITY_DN1285_c0_g7~~TRINITY_DN1285_c0_g7_i1.p1  ORF type:complete len:216 (+),score=37.29 TRINITY_DN1285_c0_g7_i1:64-648(+)
MNIESFQLEPLVLEPFQIKAVLRCLLHTIMFNRALGNVRPKEMDCEVFEIFYVRCDDAQINKAIEENVELFYRHLLQNRKGKLTLSFYKSVTKSTLIWSREEKIHWERWYIPMALAPESQTTAERNRLRASCDAAVRDRIMYILSMANEKKDHLPPVHGASAISYPFEMAFPSSDDSWSLMSMFGNSSPILLQP